MTPHGTTHFAVGRSSAFMKQSPWRAMTKQKLFVTFLLGLFALMALVELIFFYLLLRGNISVKWIIAS